MNDGIDSGFGKAPFRPEGGEYTAESDPTRYYGGILGARAPGNATGINPTEFKVLIDPKEAETKIGSIIIPSSKVEAEKYATIEGRIVAISHLAFTYATEDEWDGMKPKAGDVVLYAKYAGVRVKGKDGREYLLVNDKDIVATVEE